MRKNKKPILYTALFCAAVLLGACAAPEAAPAEKAAQKPVVAVTILPQESFVRAVGGDLVEIVTMVPPGGSPETYEATPKQMADMSDAALYFSIGVPAEEQSILPSLGADTKLVPLHTRVAGVYAELEMDGGRDPHIWLSPRRAVVMTEAIRDELCALDPANAAQYGENAAAYIALLEDVDAKIKERLANLPSRDFIVFHPAFAYFAADYGLRMHALEEHGKEATPARLAELIDFAKRENIRVIFYQAEHDSRQSEAFAEEIGGLAVELAPLAPDYTENLLRMAEALAGDLQ